jgi:hypothetical protein
VVTARLRWVVLAIYDAGRSTGAARDALRRAKIPVRLSRVHLYPDYTNVCVPRGRRRDARAALVRCGGWRFRRPTCRAWWPWSRR